MSIERNPKSVLPVFYTSTEHFVRRFDKIGRQLAFDGKTRSAALAWQRQLRRKLIELLGLDTFEKARQPQPKRLGRADCGKYWREEWIINTEPDVEATFYLLVPKNLQRGERRPAVLCPHGHASGGKLST